MQPNALLVRVCWVALISAIVWAERLPLRTYSNADGVPSSTVNCIENDRRGFLWLCSYDGLIRFDGHKFVSYGPADGLPDRIVTAFLETTKGEYWVGTLKGLARFEPEASRHGRAPFATQRLGVEQDALHITALVEGPDGAIWCGTRKGLYRLDAKAGFDRVEIGLPKRNWTTDYVKALAVDKAGALWIGTGWSGLYRRKSNGLIDHVAKPPLIEGITVDHRGSVWVAASGGVHRFDDNQQGLLKPSRLYGLAQGLPSQRPRDIVETEDHSIWVATEAGLAVLRAGADTFSSYDERHGLSEIQLKSLGIDPQGNLWIAGESYLMRLAQKGIVTYDTLDGLGAKAFVSMLEGHSDGHAYFVNGYREIVINRTDGARFLAVRPRLERDGKRLSYMGWGTGQTVLQDHKGDWWIPTGEGLCRFTDIRELSDLAKRPPTAIYGAKDGLPGDDIFSLFEDREGDVWVGTVSQPGLARWDRASGTFHRAQENDGFATANPPARYAEDLEGNLWVGMYWQGVGRRRQGRWQIFGPADGAPRNTIWGIATDGRGRVWIASGGDGLFRIDNPSAEHPAFQRYSVREGLSGEVLTALTIDKRDRIFVAGTRGVDVLDADTGRVRHLDASDGLAAGDIFAVMCDRSGTVWFGAALGLSKLINGAVSRANPTGVRITKVRAAGVDQKLAALGEEGIFGLTLRPDENHLDIDVSVPYFEAGAVVRYQYRLNATEPWLELGEVQTVSLIGLGAGSYGVEVRALIDGVPSGHAAKLFFEVLPPLWRRWWVQFMASLCLGGLLYWAHRYRVAQVVAMEKVRTRIAMDLHDDVGSTLSQLSILSEVARQQTQSGPTLQLLSHLAEISRELATAMGDIVWALSPERDKGADLAQRIRRFGEDLLGGREIEFECNASQHVIEAILPADIRRETYLIFKESAHNIARHSGARQAWADLRIESGSLWLIVRDDGRGLPTTANGNRGHGLASMKKRAENIRGHLEVRSEVGRGTEVILSAPMRRYSIR